MTATEGKAHERSETIGLVSLVVVAHNEENYLPNLLADICAQDFPHPAVEVLLVDSASTDATRRQMEAFASEKTDFCSVLVLDNPERYLPHGCNVALSAFSGDVFLRIDAHARIPRDFVRLNVQVLQEGHDICGGVRPEILETSGAWGEVLLASEGSAFGASLPGYRRKSQVRGEVVSSVFHGAYRRFLFAEVGNYDERLLRTEDNDMSQRLRAAGYEIWMDARISSHQYLRPGYRALLRQKAANGYWIGRTLWLKPKAVSLLHLAPAVFIASVLAGIGVGLLFSWWPLLILLFVYGCACVRLSIEAVFLAKNRVWQMVFLPLVIVSLHLVYGASTWGGLLRGLLPARK